MIYKFIDERYCIIAIIMLNEKFIIQKSSEELRKGSRLDGSVE